MGNPHLSIFQPIAPLDAAPQRLYALDKHLKAAADNHNTSGPLLILKILLYLSWRLRIGGSPFRDSTSSAHSESLPLSSPISSLLEILHAVDETPHSHCGHGDVSTLLEILPSVVGPVYEWPRRKVAVSTLPEILPWLLTANRRIEMRRRFNPS